MDWIDIKEKQPTAEDYYFTVDMDSKRKQVNYLRWSDERKQFEYYSQDFIQWMWLTVTHWMPFPKLPEPTDGLAYYKPCVDGFYWTDTRDVQAEPSELVLIMVPGFDKPQPGMWTGNRWAREYHQHWHPCWVQYWTKFPAPPENVSGAK